MEWRKISITDQDDWEIQYDVVAYYGKTIGRKWSIVQRNEPEYDVYMKVKVENGE